MSSSSPVISVKNIKKYFEIYEKPSHRLFQMICRGKKQFFKPYWALRDITFTVNEGECVGIIGRNGAGKSTLLQIVTGTLAPSGGKVTVRGRVAALLELGSGFNPEFTGKENVYLNASILGLTDSEVDAQYNSIVKFADIGDFIDQPVKTYSSGMTVRLAFAVIAHVNADVLIIDEALSVGDAFFTQKCMRFLRKFLETKTILFVSHDIAAVNSLCNKAILLENGTVKMEGSPKEVTQIYMKDMYESQQGSGEHETIEEDPSVRNKIPVYKDEDYHDMRSQLINSSNLRNDIYIFKFNQESADFGKKGVVIENAMLFDVNGQPLNWIVGGEPTTLRVYLRTRKNIYSPIVGFQVKNRHGQCLFGDNTFITYMDKPLYLEINTAFMAEFSFNMPILEHGDYSFAIAVAEGTQENHVQHDWKHDAIMIQSMNTSCATGMVGIPMHKICIKEI